MSGSWQDRRFMFPSGKEVHEGSRRMSGSTPSDTTSSAMTDAAPAAGTGSTLPDHPVTEKKVLSNPDAWGGDRRFVGVRGAREVHEPARRMSGSSETKPAGAPKSSSPPATGSGGGIAAAIAGRRRVCPLHNRSLQRTHLGVAHA